MVCCHAFHGGWFKAVLWEIFCLCTPESAKIWYALSHHDRIEIDTLISVIVVSPKTWKLTTDRGHWWHHSINSYNILYPIKYCLLSAWMSYTMLIISTLQWCHISMLATPQPLATQLFVPQIGKENNNGNIKAICGGFQWYLAKQYRKLFHVLSFTFCLVTSSRFLEKIGLLGLYCNTLILWQLLCRC